MNRLDMKRRAQVVAALVEDNSIRATCRMTGVAKGTVLKLLVDLGMASAEYQDRVFRNLTCRRLQRDEIWSFCYAKAKNIPTHLLRTPGAAGDVWTWTAICADCKLIPAWHVGDRNAYHATIFMENVAGRLANRVQLTTDGHEAYLYAVEDAFEGKVDYAMLVKLYGPAPSGAETRYSPAACIGTRVEVVSGAPAPEHISTSYAERQNLTMRMSMRRFTRLTNAFSKKVANLKAAVALHFMYYNFARVHQTLRVTPAMEAKVTDHVWTIEEIVKLLDSSN